MSDLQVDIVTPQKLVYSGRATEVRAPGWEGEFDVLPGHASLLALMHGGILTLETAEGSKRFVVGRGFAEAGPDRVTILTDRCLTKEQVDRAEAEKLRIEAQGELALGNAHDELATARILEKLEIAQAMLDI
ncbi:MAG: F-type H+-transporting ATPase subunit epsilon [Kiritimatiellia bacterium]